MYRPRLIPVLLLHNLGLVKSTKFTKNRYIGDPINAVKIFNDLEADELIFLDISANLANKCISLDFVKKVGLEANMPFSVGGGIKTLNEIESIINCGSEKIVLNTHAYSDSSLVHKASKAFGSSTIAVSMDVKKTFFRGDKVFVCSGSKSTGLNPVEYAKYIEDQGAGELIVNSIDRDGTMKGYDIDLIKQISESVSIPVVALGGAGTMRDFVQAIEEGCASAVAAGSFFVYHGPRKAVLIKYPTKEELKKIFL